MKPSLSVSKLDAARRQLETAIQIYFVCGDPVSIHTLSAAAYNILRDLGRNRDVQPMLVKDQILDLARPESRDHLRVKLNEAENFFKHADRDPDATHDFSPGLSELFLLDATTRYYVLTGEAPALFKVCRSWVVVNHPEFFTFPTETAKALARSKDEVVGLGRESFFQAMLPLAMRI